MKTEKLRFKTKADEKLHWAIVEYSAIRYVYITKNKGFYLFKKPGRLVRRGQSINNPECNCIIYHKKRLYHRWENKLVENYLCSYKKNIEDAPEILVSNILKKKNAKIYVKGYSTPIKKLLRKVYLLRERRGKEKKSKIKTIRNKFIIQAYKKLKSKGRLPIKDIQKKLMDKADEYFKDNLELAKKCYCSDTTVWRVIKNCERQKK